MNWTILLRICSPKFRILKGRQTVLAEACMYIVIGRKVSRWSQDHWSPKSVNKNYDFDKVMFSKNSAYASWVPPKGNGFYLVHQY